MADTDQQTCYIATAIPYVNGAPHVGHAMEAVISDVLARYHRQLGDDTIMTLGTDEHGGKNMETAQSLGISPQAFVDQNTAVFKELYTALDVHIDRFTRTTDKAHISTSQEIWKRLEKYIYKGSYSGMYDTKEETFVSEDEARQLKNDDPERFARLHAVEEENYFFKLSKFTKQIQKAIESGEFEIVPVARRNEVRTLLNEGLHDISISRPKSKIPWGVEVPGDKDQVMYVWFEALINYLSVLGYPSSDDVDRYWPANYQVVGKDITRFHAVIWPAMLLGLELPLPEVLYVHGFVTMNGRKMSKSIGNVVSPLEILSDYGVDAMRYYFMRHIPSHGDGDFTWEKFEAAYNGELGNDLGNLVQRVSKMIHRYQDGVIGDIPEPEHDTGPYHQAFDELRFDKALEYTWGLIRGLNQYLEAEKPWELAKSKDEQEHIREIFAYVVGSLMQITSLLHPFMPRTAATINAMFKDGVVNSAEGVLFPRKELHVAAAKTQ